MNKQIELIYDFVISFAKEEFPNELKSLYIIGSLAHGGFSDFASDLDIAIILDSKKITDKHWEKIAKIESKIYKSRLPYSDRVSIFWTNMDTLINHIPSGAFPTTTRKYGSFPPFDILDLYQNGILVYGENIVSVIRKINNSELFICAVEFLLSYVNSPSRNRIIGDTKEFQKQTPVAASKTILFPVRLIYTFLSGRIGGNDSAYAYFLENMSLFGLKNSAMVDEAMKARDQDKFDYILVNKYFKDVIELYRKVIFLSMQEVDHANKYTYLNELKNWLRILETGV